MVGMATSRPMDTVRGKGKAKSLGEAEGRKEIATLVGLHGKNGR